MRKSEIGLFRTLIEKLRQPEAMPYSSDPEFENGLDMGREYASDQLEWLLNELVQIKENKKKG